MVEEWTSCPDFPNYEISSHGRLRSILYKEIKKPSVNLAGVHYVTLYHPELKRGSVKSIANLVARAFILPEQDEYNTVVHSDGDRSNLKAENLFWHTRSFAINYHKEMNGRFDKDDDFEFFCMNDGSFHTGLRKLARELHVLPSAIEYSINRNNNLYDSDRAKEWMWDYIWPQNKAYISRGTY